MTHPNTTKKHLTDRCQAQSGWTATSWRTSARLRSPTTLGSRRAWITSCSPASPSQSRCA